MVMQSAVVTPFVGVWIEMPYLSQPSFAVFVTPFVGVWIEIWKSPHNTAPPLVTPFVGVWIEIVPISNISTI